MIVCVCERRRAILSRYKVRSHVTKAWRRQHFGEPTNWPQRGTRPDPPWLLRLRSEPAQPRLRVKQRLLRVEAPNWSWGKKILCPDYWSIRTQGFFAIRLVNIATLAQALIALGTGRSPSSSGFSTFCSDPTQSLSVMFFHSVF